MPYLLPSMYPSIEYHHTMPMRQCCSLSIRRQHTEYCHPSLYFDGQVDVWSAGVSTDYQLEQTIFYHLLEMKYNSSTMTFVETCVEMVYLTLAWSMMGTTNIIIHTPHNFCDTWPCRSFDYMQFHHDSLPIGSLQINHCSTRIALSSPHISLVSNSIQ